MSGCSGATRLSIQLCSSSSDCWLAFLLKKKKEFIAAVCACFVVWPDYWQEISSPFVSAVIFSLFLFLILKQFLMNVDIKMRG